MIHFVAEGFFVNKICKINIEAIDVYIELDIKLETKMKNRVLDRDRVRYRLGMYRVARNI